jgi:hypothetical protein
MTKKKVQLTVQFSCSRVTACQREREQLIGKQKSTLGAAENAIFSSDCVSPHARCGRTLRLDCHWIIANCSALRVVILLLKHNCVCWERTNMRIKGWADVSFAAADRVRRNFQLPLQSAGMPRAGCFNASKSKSRNQAQRANWFMALQYTCVIIGCEPHQHTAPDAYKSGWLWLNWRVDVEVSQNKFSFRLILVGEIFIAGINTAQLSAHNYTRESGITQAHQFCICVMRLFSGFAQVFWQAGFSIKPEVF